MESEEMELRDLGTKGYIRFSIKSDDTEANTAVHLAFKEFCKLETDNNYTQGIRKLLEYYQSDFKFESIWERMSIIEDRLNKLEAPKEEKVEEEVEDNGAF